MALGTPRPQGGSKEDGCIKSQTAKVESSWLCNSLGLRRALRFRFGSPVSRHHLATDDCFRAQLVADVSFAFHASYHAFPNQNVNFKAQLVAGKNRAPAKPCP